MRRHLALAGAALALCASPGAAQQSDSPAQADNAAPLAPIGDSSAPAPAGDAAVASGQGDSASTPTASVTGSQLPAPATDPAPAASAEVAGTVRRDWPKYDKGNKGSLTALEFGTWILNARGIDVVALDPGGSRRGGNQAMIRVLNATASEFMKADSDRSRSISPDELTVYLST